MYAGFGFLCHEIQEKAVEKIGKNCGIHKERRIKAGKKREEKVVIQLTFYSLSPKLIINCLF